MSCSLRPWLVMILVLVCGCGKSSPPLVPVSGKVTLDNRPLAKAVVRFMPVNPEDPESSGSTDEDGRYSLKPTTKWSHLDGAVPGEYRVQIGRYDREAMPPRQLVPERYSGDTELVFTVPPQGGTADFHLTTQESGHRR